MDNEKQMQELAFYKEELLKLKEENMELASKITTLEAQKGEAEQKLAQIKGSFAWKLSKPLRLVRVGLYVWVIISRPKRLPARFAANVWKRRLTNISERSPCRMKM